jgi:hypothetical protein
MTSRCFSRRAGLALLLGACALRANDLELSLSLGSGYAGMQDLYLEDAQGDTVQTRFQGPWTLGGIRADYQVYKHESLKYWVGAGYVASLGAPDYTQRGVLIPSALAGSTENFQGTCSYRREQAGVGATWSTGTLGEYGAFLWLRNNRLGLDGTASTIILNGSYETATASRSIRSNALDAMLELSMDFLQTQPTYRTLERISLGATLAHAYGNVAVTDWQLNDAYAQRQRPGLEISFSFGVRL